MDHKAERENDGTKIRNSKHPRKVVVAGPGTGKSHLFGQLINDKIKLGKSKFLAITFIGKLGDALADELCGLADTMTMHGFASSLVREQCGSGWVYYPEMYKIIKEDLEKSGISEFKIGDDNYKKRTAYYKAIGDSDVLHYAIQICKKDSTKIPIYDLILVDEFQDFNELENEFVEILASKNEVVIVGDDDQVLFGFRGSSPKYLRNKFEASNNEWESHTLRFCSRCTDVVIRYFHLIVEKYHLNNVHEADTEKRRIEKDYICYSPVGEKDSKIPDSEANQKIILMRNCPPGMLAYKIHHELQSLVKNQKIKDALIIGEAQTCKFLLSDIANFLRDYGFKYINYPLENPIKLNNIILDAYKYLQQDENSRLGWRLLDNPDNSTKDEHLKRIKTLKKILKKEPVAESSVRKLIDAIELSQITPEVLIKDLAVQNVKDHFKIPDRPLTNIEITVCNILQSKGLGADVVFVVGFDQGKLPAQKEPEEKEIFQMLVALTRVKKRIYLMNTVNNKVSSFIDCLPKEFIDDETISS